jgi:hypothetical protein
MDPLSVAYLIELPDGCASNKNALASIPLTRAKFFAIFRAYGK